MSVKSDNIKAFVKYLKQQVTNHSLYLWGGQGEKVETGGFVNVKHITNAEQTAETAKRVVDKIVDCYKAGYNMAYALFFDCSGLGVYYFLKYGFITSDTTADGLYNLCKKHPEMSELKKGDMVFKSKTSAGKWGHVGYVGDKDADGNLIIYEARGRAYGVVCRPLSAGDWTGTGRPDFWSKEVTKAKEAA